VILRSAEPRVSSTPEPTKIGLLATLAVTALTLAAFLREAVDGEVDGRTTGSFLSVFAVLFLLRVLGQIVVAKRAPGWLPPMQQWNLLPYKLLLPIQLVFLLVMAWILLDLFREDGFFASPGPGFGRTLIGFSFVYAAAMAVRYAVRMSRRAQQRWFGGTIPILFHLVLAAFCLTLGTHYASG
jgi:hypothetical protein